MHAHFGEPLLIADVEPFIGLSAGAVGTIIIEGARVFDLDNPTEAVNISNVSIGKVQVVATIQTLISSLPFLKSFITEEEFEELGFGSREKLKRNLLSAHPHKKDIKWITVVKYRRI